MKKIKILLLGLIAFQTITASGQQRIPRPDIPSSVIKALEEAKQNRTTDTILVENSIIALSQVLYKWSGHRSFENLMIALSDEVVRYNSVDPLVATAAQMTHLAAALERPDLYWESLSVIQALSPGMAEKIQTAQQRHWPTANHKSKSTIFEKLQAQQFGDEVFEAEVFDGEGAEGKKFTWRAEAVGEFDTSDDRVQSSEDYISDAIYGSFEDSIGGASQSRNNPLVQKILAGRQSESASAVGNYVRNIIDDGQSGAAVGAELGTSIGVLVGGAKGAIAGGAIGTTGGFVVGASLGAYDRYDDYKEAKNAEEKAANEKTQREKEQQQKEAQEKAEKDERERQERGKQKAREDEEKVKQVEDAEKWTNTGTGVNPNKMDGLNGSSPFRLLELITKFRKLINFRKDIGASPGLLIITRPHAGVTDPGKDSFENSKGPSKLKIDQSGFTDPGRNSVDREVSR